MTTTWNVVPSPQAPGPRHRHSGQSLASRSPDPHRDTRRRAGDASLAPRAPPAEGRARHLQRERHSFPLPFRLLHKHRGGASRAPEFSTVFGFCLNTLIGRVNMSESHRAIAIHSSNGCSRRQRKALRPRAPSFLRHAEHVPPASCRHIGEQCHWAEPRPKSVSPPSPASMRVDEEGFYNQGRKRPLSDRTASHTNRLYEPSTGVTAFEVIQKNIDPESGRPSRPNCRITGRVRVGEQATDAT